MLVVHACSGRPHLIQPSQQKKPERIAVQSGLQDQVSRKALERILDKKLSDSTYAVCGENGHFAVITETNSNWWDVYFCEGNNSTTMRCVGGKKIGTPLGECSLFIQQALQLKGDYLLLIHPSHGSGYAAWFPKVYNLNDWKSRSIHQEEFVQFSWWEEDTTYYQCSTSFMEEDGVLYGCNDTTYFGQSRTILRSSKGKVVLAE